MTIDEMLWCDRLDQFRHNSACMKCSKSRRIKCKSYKEWKGAQNDLQN